MELIAQRHRVARKEHKCDLCNGQIEKGTKYSYAFIKDNGDHWSFKSHLECEFVANELWDFINPWDGMRDDDFLDGCHDFCQHMICPKCPHFDGNCCDQDEYFCFDKIVEVLKEYDFTLVKCDLPEARGKRCWGFVKKENPVTKLPRYEK
jgi:hypothetical protein